MKNLTKNEDKYSKYAGALYGLKDLASPYVQFKGTLGECFREARGLALCSIERHTYVGWVTVAIKYYDKKFIQIEM